MNAIAGMLSPSQVLAEGLFWPRSTSVFTSFPSAASPPEWISARAQALLATLSIKLTLRGVGQLGLPNPPGRRPLNPSSENNRACAAAGLMSRPSPSNSCTMCLLSIIALPASACAIISYFRAPELLCHAKTPHDLGQKVTR